MLFVAPYVYTRKYNAMHSVELCLYFLKQLKRSVAGRDDLLCFCGTVIWPVLEYACPAWHWSLTAAQSKTLGSIQQRAMRIIFTDNDYMLSLILAGLDMLGSRRDQLTERFFRRSVLCEASCLHYLLPQKRDSVSDRTTPPCQNISSASC